MTEQQIIDSMGWNDDSIRLLQRRYIDAGSPGNYVDWLEEQAREENEMCGSILGDELPTEPSPEDWVTDDYKTWVRHDRPRTKVTTNPDNWAQEMEAVMEADGFYPSLWYCGERGDWNLLTTENGGGFHAEKK